MPDRQEHMSTSTILFNSPVSIMYGSSFLTFTILRNSDGDIVGYNIPTPDLLAHEPAQFEEHFEPISLVSHTRRNTRPVESPFHVENISMELMGYLFEEQNIHLDEHVKLPRASSARFNRREAKRRAYKKRLALRAKNARISPQGESNVESVPDMSEQTIETRNAMARAATTAAPQKESNTEEMSFLLKSIASVEDYAPDITKDLPEVDEWLSHLENLVILGYHLKKSDSFMDVFVAICAYAKMYSKNKSVMLELYRIIDEVTSVTEIDPQGDVHDALGKWELFKKNKIFSKISYLISAVMSLSVCTTKNVEWSPLGLKLISIEAAKEQLDAVDVIDALVKTFVWVSDTGWRCFETKSLAPLLYADAAIQEYNEICDFVMAKADAAIAGNIDDIGAFEISLKGVLEKTCKLKSVKNDGVAALWLQKRYSELIAIQEKLLAKRKNTDMRFQPFGVSLHGGTSVGKTTLGKLTMLQALAAMGYKRDDGTVDESRILTLDMFDQYNSTFTSDILGVFMDDIGNTRAEFNRTSPHTAVIIKFFNNVAAQAIKAELNAKGVVFIDFKVGIATTNVKDLDARAYSNCPESILRRFIHVEVTIKPQYRLDDSEMLNTLHPDLQAAPSLAHDIWELTLEVVQSKKMKVGKESYKWKQLWFTDSLGNKRMAKKIGLKDYLYLITKLAQAHKQGQDKLIKKNKKSGKSKFCPHCSQFPEFCECIPATDESIDELVSKVSSVVDLNKDETPPDDSVDRQKIEPHGALDSIGEVIVNAGAKSVENYISSWFRPVSIVNWCVGFSPVKYMTTRALSKSLQQEINREVTPLIVALTPGFVYDNKYFKGMLSSWRHASALYDMRNFWRFTIFTSLSVFGFGMYRKSPLLVGSGASAAWTSTVVGYFLHQQRMQAIEQRYIRTRDALPVAAKRFRDGCVPKGILFVATLGIGVKLISLWNDHRKKTLPQAITPEDVEEQPGWFGWITKTMTFSPKSSVTGATPSHLNDVVQSHLGRADFKSPDGRSQNCNILYPMKGILWFPRHIFHKDSDLTITPYKWLKITVRRGPDNQTSQFRCIAELGVNAILCEDLDMVCCFTARCPDIKDNFMKHLITTVQRSGTSIGTLVVRNKNGTVIADTMNITFEQSGGHRFLPFAGGHYKTDLAVNGTCMAPVYCEGKQPAIVGVHMGGDGDRHGVFMTITKSQGERFINKVLQLPGVRGLSQATDIPGTQYGRQVRTSIEVHKNAKYLHDLDNTAEIDQLGSTKLRREAVSQVRRSEISPHVEQHFGVKNVWGAPRLKPNWAAFNATLKHMVNPADPFLPSSIERARKDWVDPIIAWVKEFQKHEIISPLSDKECFLGVPGKRFLDAMPMDTSMGFPMFGPKCNFFQEIFDSKGNLFDRIPCQEIKDEMARLKAAWLKGERAYPVTSATLKDEPTPLDKEKVRVFQAGAVALGFYIRKYFLPIARLLSLNPLLSESAVGINAFGPQWKEMMDYAEKFAGEPRRVNAWDYRKYDVRMGGDVTYAVLMSMIDIAMVCLGYDKEDITIMTAMVADMIHPVIDYNGSLIMAYNLNTSGNNITVNINGAAGALYPRMHFFETFPELENFRDWVALITYGDDAKASVHRTIRSQFNFMTYKEFLARHNMEITLPDKSEDVSYDLSPDDADFLKRQSNFIPEIGTEIGRIDEMSIFKSLHSNLKSKTATPREVSVSCIESAMHEWFAFGKETYEDRQKKMIKVCEDANLPVPAVHVTYQERVDMWKNKYGEPLDTQRPNGSGSQVLIK